MFQVLSTRKRKDADASEIKVQVAVFGFDLLYLNGEALVRQSFRDRRDKLKAHFKEVEGEFLFAKSADLDTMEHVQELLEDSVKGKELIFCLLCNLPSLFVCTTLQSRMNAKLSKQRFWHCHENGLIKTIQTGH